MPEVPGAVAVAFLSAAVAIVVVTVALGAALALYQRRFLAMHRAYAESLLKAQEDERAWVAREVHDDVLQRVFVVLQELESWKSHGNGMAERIAPVRREIEDLAVVLRRLAHHLHPAFPEQLGPEQMLRQLAAEFVRSSDLAVDLRTELPAAVPIPRDTALAVYRIAQEALTNVVRHAEVPTVLVRLREHDGGIELVVQDGGRGFDVEARTGRGLGLLSMTERARAVGGACSVRSRPGAGTVIEVRLPVTPAAA